jgi:hypothetical protein
MASESATEKSGILFFFDVLAFIFFFKFVAVLARASKFNHTPTDEGNDQRRLVDEG